MKAWNREEQRQERDVEDSDSVYKEFVKQWCFEESPLATASGGWRGLVVG